MIFIVLCYIYSGIDRGIDPSYRAVYYAQTFDSKENVEQYLVAHHSEECSVFEGKKIDFDVQLVKVQREEDLIIGIKLKP